MTFICQGPYKNPLILHKEKRFCNSTLTKKSEQNMSDHCHLICQLVPARCICFYWIFLIRLTPRLYQKYHWVMQQHVNACIWRTVQKQNNIQPILIEIWSNFSFLSESQQEFIHSLNHHKSCILFPSDVLWEFATLLCTISLGLHKSYQVKNSLITLLQTKIFW